MQETPVLDSCRRFLRKARGSGALLVNGKWSSLANVALQNDEVEDDPSARRTHSLTTHIAEISFLLCSNFNCNRVSPVLSRERELFFFSQPL
jgi:hypothetical protein